MSVLRRCWVVLLARAALVACCPASYPGTVQFTEEVTAALVHQNGHIYCAAVWISDSEMLTAGHCVADAGLDDIQQMLQLLVPGAVEWSPVGQTVYYETPFDGAPRTAIVKSYSQKDDLGLLALPEFVQGPEHPVATLGVAPTIGDLIQVVGHPFGIGWTYVRGRVSKPSITPRDPAEDEIGRMQVAAPIYPGDSGGGAFDSGGALIGICSRYVRGTEIGFFVARDTIANFLKETHNETHTGRACGRRSGLGLQCLPPPANSTR